MVLSAGDHRQAEAERKAASLMLRSAAKQRVSTHEAALSFEA
jgi:hypothetical protein